MRRLAVLLAIASSACQHGHGDQPSGQPADAVTQLYAAIASGDCARITALTGGDLAARIGGARCDAALEDFRHHQVALRRLRETVVDGRDPNAHLVRVVVSFDGRDHEVQLRVVAQAGAWQVVTM